MPSECRKCNGEDFSHHATTCPKRAKDMASSQSTPIPETDPNFEAYCSYCGEKITREEFMLNHTMKRCQPTDSLAKEFQADGEEFLQDDFDRRAQ